MEEGKRPHNVVIGQRVAEDKRLLAERMRRHMTPTEAKLWGRLRQS